VIKQFLTLVLTTFALFGFVIFYHTTKETYRDSLNFTKVTTIVEPALSVSNLDDRFLLLEKKINRAYPQMPKAQRVGFVYVK